MNKKITALAAAVVIIATGLFLWAKNNKAVFIDEPSNSIKTGDILVSKEGWRTYVDSAGRFEISFPEKWAITANQNTFNIIPDETNDPFYAPIAIGVRDNSANQSVKDWFVENYPLNEDDLKDFHKTNLSGAEEALVWSRMSTDFTIYEYYGKKDGKIYTFSLMDIQQNIENENAMMKAIVSTFKFIGSPF